jgi:hypothetical protein
MSVAELMGRLRECNEDHEIVDVFAQWIKGVCFREFTKESLTDLRNTINTISEDIYQEHRKNRISWCGRCVYELSRNCVIPNEDEISEGKKHGVIKIHNCDKMDCKEFVDFSG